LIFCCGIAASSRPTNPFRGTAPEPFFIKSASDRRFSDSCPKNQAPNRTKNLLNHGIIC
jgi:hypothetical protein